MNKWVAGTLVGGLAVAGLATPADATPAARTSVRSAASVVRVDDTMRLHPRERFARELAKRGMSDGSAYSIDHVHELQYRLRWVGVFRGKVTGYYGRKTARAVKRFQRRAKLRRTGVANPKTWAKLIRRTTRRRNKIPRVCKRRGWHACYDRKAHQVTLFRSGKLWNAWLVRGGMATHPTRKGTHDVYYRDRDHVSHLYGSPMPYSQFFDGGQALHGSPYMTDPFVDHSHGCINMYIEDARQLWKLTSSKRLTVTVYGAWD